MKNFEFSMQKVLEYKEHLEDKEKNELTQMRWQYDRLFVVIEAMQKEYENIKDQYMNVCTRGTNATEMTIFKTHMDEFVRLIEQMLINLHKAEEEIDIQRNLLLVISKEKNTMGKLKSRHYAAYKAKQQKEMEIFIDDFVTNTTINSTRF